MKQQKKIKGGVSIEQVQVIPYFSGKKIYFAINERGSEILLDRDQVEEFEEIMNQQKKTNCFQQEKIPASLFRKQPQNITKQQTKIEKHIQHGNQKSSQINTPGSVLFPSIIFQSQNCEFCDSKESIIQDKNQQILKLTTTNNHLTKQLEHLTDKVTKYQDQIRILVQQKIKILQQNQQLKKFIQEQKKLISVKFQSKKSLSLSKLSESKMESYLQLSEQENKIQLGKSNQIKLNLAQNCTNPQAKPYLQVRRNQSIILVELQTQKNCRDTLNVQLPATVREEVNRKLKDKQKSQIWADTFSDVINSIKQSSQIFCTLNDQELEDLDLKAK